MTYMNNRELAFIDSIDLINKTLRICASIQQTPIVWNSETHTRYQGIIKEH